jgi:replicative DNA helicase
MFDERPPIATTEAEQSVLGSCLLDEVALANVMTELQPSHFFVDRHAKIYKAILAMDAKGAVDPVTVGEYLRVHGQLQDVGGMSYLASLLNTVPTTANVMEYARIVKEQSTRRRIITNAMETMALARDESRPIDEVLGQSEASILSVREPPKDELDPETWGYEVETEAALLREGGPERRRIKTGIHIIDDRLNLWPGFLTTVAGDTGIGKSTTTAKIARESALRLGQQTYLWLGEAVRSEFWERVVAAELRIDYDQVQQRTFNAADGKRIREFMREFKQASITVRDKAMTVADIRADCRHLAHKGRKPDVIIVDYLLLLKDLNAVVEGSDRRDVRVGQVVWNLLEMAKELDCHVLLVHQFNRTKSSRATGRPRLSDLKESSAIEQHSANVMLLYRPDRDEALEPADRDQFRGLMEVIIPKARHGKTGNVWLNFEGQYQDLLKKHRPWPGDATFDALPLPKPQKGRAR